MSTIQGKSIADKAEKHSAPTEGAVTSAASSRVSKPQAPAPAAKTASAHPQDKVDDGIHQMRGMLGGLMENKPPPAAPVKHSVDADGTVVSSSSSEEDDKTITHSTRTYADGRTEEITTAYDPETKQSVTDDVTKSHTDEDVADAAGGPEGDLLKQSDKPPLKESDTGTDITHSPGSPRTTAPVPLPARRWTTRRPTSSSLPTAQLWGIRC